MKHTISVVGGTYGAPMKQETQDASTSSGAVHPPPVDQSKILPAASELLPMHHQPLIVQNGGQQAVYRHPVVQHHRLNMQQHPTTTPQQHSTRSLGEWRWGVCLCAHPHCSHIDQPPGHVACGAGVEFDSNNVCVANTTQQQHDATTDDDRKQSFTIEYAFDGDE
jgi:hypothetical protein